jgi:cytoskeleton protein RodZ
VRRLFGENRPMPGRARDEQPDETANMKILAIGAGVLIGVSLLAMITVVSSKGYSILMRTAVPSPQETASKPRPRQTPLSEAPPKAPQPSLPRSVPMQSPAQPAKQIAGSARQSASLGVTQGAQTLHAVVPRVASGQTRLAIKANQGSWVDACPDGRIAFRRYLPPPNTVDLRFSSYAVIRLGNAGGIEISVDGAPTGPLGAVGQIRVVHFDLKGYHFLMPGDPGTECGK